MTGRRWCSNLGFLLRGRVMQVTVRRLRLIMDRTFTVHTRTIRITITGQALGSTLDEGLDYGRPYYRYRR